jgi:hypothetical protein
MKSFFKVLLFILAISCNQNDSRKPNNEPGSKENDSIVNNTALTKDSVDAKEKPVTTNSDSVVRAAGIRTDSFLDGISEKNLVILSSKILKSLKENAYTGLAEFIHPKIGIRFSPYGYIDTAVDQILSRNKLIVLGKSQKKIKWGFEDATGKPIKLSLNDYVKKFVYDVDFLNAEKKGVNKFFGEGNSLNNLKEVYPRCNFVEFYFSGFDPKFGGMDWRAVRLVFKDYKRKYYLVAIVHDQWTI